ncbi:radical SAM family heme chaperone HemW [Thaumasiovibrio sp. DFM-14]|uniref:radical SAM family heme chaperone HemW n=1 Tax=Thaumasiovibrio sp. DFM-14 TaxID=3384792 RepID=UPI0039A31268
MITPPPLSLYVHIPWCVQKCPYCDFNSHALKSKVPEADYIDALLDDLAQDLRRLGPFERPLHSIFIGGGTPSLISPEEITRLLQGIASVLPFSPEIEITMEANPGTVEAGRFDAYRQAGINRISIGVQSFDNEKLTRLGRVHDANEAISAAQTAAQAGLNSFNLDLMHGLPTQSSQQAIADLQQAIALNPPHLSWYQLTLEPNTLFGSQPPTLPDDDELWAIFEQGHQLLEQAGYVRYEISGYSKPGYQCRHNLNYWRFGDYLGIGCGAHGKFTFADGRIERSVKVKHPRGYLDTNKAYLVEQWEVEAQDRPFEFFMNRFRLIEPCPKSEFSATTGLALTHIHQPIEQAKQQGLLTEDDHSWHLTEKGLLFFNDLIALFVDGE